MAGRLLDRSEKEIIAIESQFNKVHEFSQLEENPRIEPQPRRLNELGQLVQREQPQPQPQNEVEGKALDLLLFRKFGRQKAGDKFRSEQQILALNRKQIRHFLRAQISKAEKAFERLYIRRNEKATRGTE